MDVCNSNTFVGYCESLFKETAKGQLLLITIFTHVQLRWVVDEPAFTLHIYS